MDTSISILQSTNDAKDLAGATNDAKDLAGATLEPIGKTPKKGRKSWPAH